MVEGRSIWEKWCDSQAVGEKAEAAGRQIPRWGPAEYGYFRAGVILDRLLPTLRTLRVAEGTK